MTVAHAVERQIAVALEVTGSFQAEESSDVAPASPGRVVRTPVSIGSFVRAGEVICELDHRDAASKLAQVQAQLSEAAAGVRQAQSKVGLANGDANLFTVPEVAAAKANYESAEAQARLADADAKRYANLVRTGDVSQSVYEKQRTQAETATAQVNAAKQQLEATVNSARQSYIAITSSEAVLESVRAQYSQAQKALDDTTIRAPFDGYVSARAVAVGEFVTTSTTVATIVRLDTLRLQLLAPEKDVAALAIAMPVQARVAAYGEREFQGQTSALNPSVNPDSRAVLIEAKFANQDKLLRPGMFANARIDLPRTERAVFVPKSAVVHDRTTDANQIFVVQDGKARMRVVTLAQSENGLIRVLNGVAAGDLVVTNRQTDLFDGAPVSAQTN